MPRAHVVYGRASTNRRAIAARQLGLAFMLAALAATSAGNARAFEIIPSVGITKSTDTNAEDAKGFGGLAIRASVLPFLKAEGGIGYRQDSFAAGDVEVRQWPVTASLWVTPLSMLYAGGGVGWYRTTFDYRGTLPFEDSTRQKMGVHLGGGLNLPVTSRLGLDLNGRYVFMQKGDEDLQVPTSFNPDFWATSLGLAIEF
jgi:hypothetical protein